MKTEMSSVVSQASGCGEGRPERPFPVPSAPGISLFDDLTSTRAGGGVNCLASVFAPVVGSLDRNNLRRHVSIRLCPNICMKRCLGSFKVELKCFISCYLG